MDKPAISKKGKKEVKDLMKDFKSEFDNTKITVQATEALSDIDGLTSGEK